MITNMNTTCDIAVIGGGAAGLVAAITAAQNCSGRIVILEADDRVGRSILKTGNGRCNFSNEHIANGRELNSYRNAPFVSTALSALQDEVGETAHRNNAQDVCDPVLDFFESLGLEWRQEDDGRRYPLANKASVVLDVLRAEAHRLGVEEACGNTIAVIEAPHEMRGASSQEMGPTKKDSSHKQGGLFTLRTTEGVFWRAQAVIIACGGTAIGKLNVPANHVVLPLQPVLGPMRVTQESAAFTRELDNIRVRCTAQLFHPDPQRPQAGSVLAGSEQGELLFRTYGVSGICVFDLSRKAQPGSTLCIDFLQTNSPDQAQAYLSARYDQLSARYSQLTCEQFLRGLVLPRVADVLCKYIDCAPTVPLSPAILEKLGSALTQFSLEVAGMGPEENCQVHRGGLSCESFSATTMESRLTPGLFACGEALDVDGPCGGFNLHWAWVSGMLAGNAAAKQC